MRNHKKVILSPVYWRFFDYVQGSNNPIEEWYMGLTELGRDLFDELLKQNRKVDRPKEWGGMKIMQGDCKKEGIWEWRFSDGRQQRILGIFGDERKNAVFLIGCFHKQRVYKPPEALQTAIKRARAVRDGRANVQERKINEDF